MMDEAVKQAFAVVWKKDREAQNQAYYALLAATEQPVDWAYAVWDDVVGHLSDTDNHNRSIAAQLLSSLAKSDPEERLVADFPKLMSLMADWRGVTIRHSLQSLWRVGVVSVAYRSMLVAELATMFDDCAPLKMHSMIRTDILDVFRKVYDECGDEAVKAAAWELNEREDDAKLRKRYEKIWLSA